MMRTWSGRLTLILLALGSACGREAPAPSPTPAPSPDADAAAPADDVRQVVLRSITIGKSVGPDGSVAAAVDTFAPGEPLFVSLDAQAISAGTEVRLAWRGPAGEDHGEEEMMVPAGARVINFKARDTSGWPVGEHRLEVSLGGAPVGSKPFRIVGPASPASPAPATR
ncbi:MAG TPA: hypothetical protein VMT87_13175 [Vicinamibacteria bacterium]|nr:hypothetical protein [Vicinamibacteria bacterium]